MWSKVIRRRPGLAFMVLVGLLTAVVGAGAASAEGASTVTRFLVKPGEMAGFTLGKAQVFRSVSALTDGSGEALTPPQARRYEREGFVEAALVRLRGRFEGSAIGLSTVTEFEKPEGAKAELKVELREELDPKHSGNQVNPFRRVPFQVAGVPNAVGLDFVATGAAVRAGLEAGIAKAFFVEGSCLVTVAAFRLHSEEVAGPVAGGARGVFRRTGGMCPAASEGGSSPTSPAPNQG